MELFELVWKRWIWKNSFKIQAFWRKKCCMLPLGKGGFLSIYHIPRKKIPGISRRWKILGFWSQDFSDFFWGFYIPIPGISGFPGFFDLARNKRSRSRKNLIPKPTLPVGTYFNMVWSDFFISRVLKSEILHRPYV